MFIASLPSRYSTRMKKRIDNTVIHDPLMIVKDMVRDTGEVSEELGGFLIKVINQNNFPWANVFRYLLSLNHEVWVEIRDEELYIVSCPWAD